MKKTAEALYMLIDVTTVEGTRVLKVAGLRAVSLLGKIYQAQGLQVIAPPMEGRSFAKLDKLPLQYLYWSVCQETPPEDYAELVKRCLAKLKTLPVDDTPLPKLEAEVARLYPDGTLAPAAQPKDPNAPPSRPREAGATGRVWEIADGLFAQVGGLPDRKAVLAACEAAGINGATASTQFSKWKKAKLASS